MFFRGGDKYYMYFADKSWLFPTVKEFSKSVNSWWSYCKNSTARFLRHSMQILTGAEVSTEKLCPRMYNVARHTPWEA